MARSNVTSQSFGGFTDAHATAAALADAIAAIQGLDRERLLLFGGWESATRGAGVTLQIVGERLGITEQFQGVDQIVPVDVYAPGCPPGPETLIHSILTLHQKIRTGEITGKMATVLVEQGDMVGGR